VSTEPEMGHTEIEELLGVYALDALDAETAAVVAQHLDGCVRCAIEVAQHHEVAGMLANSGGAPPVSLWDGIAGQLDGTSDQSWDRLVARLDASDDRRSAHGGSGLGTGIDATGSGGHRASVVAIGSGRRRFALTGAGVVTAAAAVLALVLGLQVHHLNGRVTALQDTPQLSAAERAALASPTTRKIAMVETTPTGAITTPASVVLTASGTGFVINDVSDADGLAPLNADRTYQLWGVVGKHTISLGLLGPHPGIVPFSVAGSVQVSALAITDEVAGGVVTSKNQAVAVAELQV
jgi:alkylhydroperoxidase family enzyme